ncbi:uncharacterized protein RHOBADRAFT_51881 [Rhodotorula graminis WP1]|uniref:Uncharacterized protein n=1 Tax=Rhodotorula graminis (strain WP1) TaxID=578459 RepID=A0A194S8G9_RHOGW|nr:uncharacterized protein RHOBADRAFT_51881 [Rhodotorula graminis WP1]KPV76897.1 hypothetical protein RHOBADRAFT_51881 [Rhodotorula graminis WP1]
MYPPLSPASSGPYPPIVSSPTSLSTPVAPLPNPYGTHVSPSTPSATRAASLRTYARSPPPPPPTGASITSGRRRPSQAELEQEAVERAMQQGIATEQRRLAALAEEDERLVRLTLEESSSSAALEQLRQNALARERAHAEERALREALLSSRNDAEGRQRDERRLRAEEEKAVQRAMAQSRRESEDSVGKGKGKARVDDDGPAHGGDEDELERREREALELAMQLSLQEEEKRRIWRGGFSAANSDPEEVEPSAATSSVPAAASTSSSYFPPSSSSTDVLDDDLPPPAYELPQHARELDEPEDIIIGPGRPLPFPPAPAPPTGAAPAQLHRLVSEKHARLDSPDPSPYASSSYSAYPSFAPYAGSHTQQRGYSGSSSLVGSASVGALSVAASAGSFEESIPARWDECEAVRDQALPFVEEPLGLGEVGPGRASTVEVDPFGDQFAEIGEEPATGPSSSDEAQEEEPAVARPPLASDLFAEVLARRTTRDSLSHRAYVSRPVLDVDQVERSSGSSGKPADDEQRTPTGLVPPAVAHVTQPVSAPTTPEPSSFLELPLPARLPSVSAPTSPSAASFRSSPSAGGFVEDLGALVPFADEHVLRDVRWGFVDDETSAAGRYPRLEYEGDFPRGSQLSAVRGADGRQAFKSFAIEARTWQNLLVFIMWHGNSRFEAAPFDLEKDKAGRGLQVAIHVDFYRSGRQASSAVSIRPPRVRVRLTLLPQDDPNTPLRRASSGFQLVGPVALEPVSPSVRLALATQPVLPLALADLATLLSQAHSASRSYMRLARRAHTGASTPLGPTAEGRIVLAQAVDLFRRLNGEEVRPPAASDDGGSGADEEVSVLDRLKARLRRRRGPRVIEGGRGRAETVGGALPEGATLITPFSLE